MNFLKKVHSDRGVKAARHRVIEAEKKLKHERSLYKKKRNTAMRKHRTKKRTTPRRRRY
jgi:hypothetical protein